MKPCRSFKVPNPSFVRSSPQIMPTKSISIVLEDNTVQPLHKTNSIRFDSIKHEERNSFHSPKHPIPSPLLHFPRTCYSDGTHIQRCLGDLFVVPERSYLRKRAVPIQFRGTGFECTKFIGLLTPDNQPGVLKM